MPQIENRKIIRIGKTSLGIILPKAWLRYYSLQASDQVEVVSNGHYHKSTQKRRQTNSNGGEPMNQQIEFLVKIRDAHLTFAKVTNEYIESLAPPEIKNEIEKPEDKETPFTELSFEREEGPKIGAFEAAYKADNLQDKWIQAYNILTASKASIKDRYHNEGYQYSYWLYEGNKIYRQKLKAKT